MFQFSRFMGGLEEVGQILVKGRLVRAAPSPLLYSVVFMDDDASATEYCGQASIIVSTYLVVVYDGVAVVLVPDLNPELVGAAAAVHLAVNGSQDEAVVTAAVDRALALELRSRPCNHEPIIGRALEVEVSHPELEFRVAGRDIRAILVLGNEPK